MANQPQLSSKLNGAPKVEVRKDRIRLVQRRHFGWIFVGFPVVLVSAFLISEYSKKTAFRRDPLSSLAYTFEKFEWFEWIAFGIASLLFCIFVISGLLYALWTRELDIDLRRKRFRFRTGLAGRIKTVALPLDKLTTLRLSRLTPSDPTRAAVRRSPAIQLRFASKGGLPIRRTHTADPDPSLIKSAVQWRVTAGNSHAQRLVTVSSHRNGHLASSALTAAMGGPEVGGSMPGAWDSSELPAIAE